jgi:hypothetical protein
MNEDQRPIVIKPRILPRDLIDVCLGLPIGIFLTIVLFGIPALIALYVTGSFGAAVFTYCTTFGVFMLFVVSRLTVKADGLHFHRILGSPKFLSWDRITSVEIASRKELILSGWLWPLFPPREMSPSLSALQNYRITWDGGYCYYPPAHIEDFERHVIPRLRNAPSDKSQKTK